MAATIGIPQSLLYYKYYPLWNTLLEELGAEIIVSKQTSKRTINAGTTLAENELCMPVKVFFGHVQDLKEKVDAIFVPRVVSVEKSAYTCPKFLGLPDLARSTDSHLPMILDPVFNSRLKKRYFYESLFEFGKFFTTSKVKVLRAWNAAMHAQYEFQRCLESGLTPNEIIAGTSVPVQTGDLTIGIAGHAYNIYDPYTSLNIISKLRSWGVNVVTTDMITPRILEHESHRLPKRLFWSYEKEVVGSAFHWLRTHSVDGIIYMLSFACGPDSLIQVLLEAEAKKQGSVPLMSLVIDEHSGEAGMITRVEAFIDMLKWRALA